VANTEVSTDVEFADVDGDGDLDLGIAKSGFGGGGQCRLLLNEGNGFFYDGTPLRMPTLLASTRDLDFGDVDNDGDADIVLANVYVFGSDVSRQNRIYINNGYGFFNDETSMPDGSAYRFPVDNASTRSLAMGDVDNDGDLDIIAANRIDNGFMGEYDGPQNRLLLNNGTGFFEDVTDARIPADTDSSRDVAVADADNDGFLDIYFGNAMSDKSFSGGGQQNRLYMNDGRGYFSNETDTRIPALERLTKSVDFGDIDNDGDLDIVEANSRHENGHKAPQPGQQDRVLVNDGNGFFTDETLNGSFSRLRLPFRIANSYDIDLGDVDGDGDLDIFVAVRYNQNSLFINRNISPF
ncbi:MAG: VCBS repeat-containing protein, partial [Thermodesulfobacteriota bacterium]|nr:VCBS repeat-containing protein [Thermodesulfobacteriota bacterium]